jgi:broad specificity phosphatase PhoE
VSTRRIFLARHGNRQDFVDPSWATLAEEPYDPPLSADGIEQARRLGHRLAGEGIDVIVASPFLRTVQTAHHANAALGAPIYLEPGFGEWLSPHSFTRAPRLRPFNALRAEYPTLHDGYLALWPLQYPESPEQLRERTHHVLGTLLGKLEGTVLVVGHAASVAAAALIDEQISSIDCPLCALFCLEHDGSRWRLSLNGETTHVGARLATFTFPEPAA